MKPYTTPQCIISHLYDKNRNFNISLLNALLNIVKLLKMMLHLNQAIHYFMTWVMPTHILPMSRSKLVPMY